MAKKKGGVNRTEKVDEYLLAHPDQSISEVLAGLAEQRVHVSRSLISQERTKLGLSQGRGKKQAAKKKSKEAAGTSVAAVRTTSPSKSAKITADELYDAKTLADQLGGVRRHRDALDALERLR